MSRRFWLAAFAVALAVQTVALYVPRTPSVGGGLPIDKVVHVALFLAVAVLGVRAGVPMPWLIALLVGQALVSELFQQVFLADRSGDLGDVVADLAGAGVGLLIGLRWVRDDR